MYMTLEQWHSNDRKSKINTRTRVKNIFKNWQSRKHTTTRVTTYYYIYLNRKRLRIIKDLRLKLLQTGSCKLWSLERSPYGLLLTGGSRECRQWAGENSNLKNFVSMSSTMESMSKHSLTKWYLYILRRKVLINPFWVCVKQPPQAHRAYRILGI